ncbi:MAG: PAS domain S-box protein [Methanoregula sp.]
MHTILYVDDEPGLLEIGKLFLERDRQFSVDPVTSAPKALALLDTKNYDAIVADYQMPEMDGIEFLKKVRATGNPIPFILFTGRGREEVVIQALNAGADFYLQKGGEPVSQFAELAHQIRQAIHKSKADASIRDHERREADIINFLPDATFAIDRSGHIIAWNRAMEEMTGVPAKEMLGKGDYEYATPFYGQRQPMLIDLIFEPDEVIARNYAHILHRKDTLIADTTLPLLRGQRVTLMGMASPLYNRQGDVVGAIESIRDLTERKLEEDALRESEERYRQIVETASEGILKMDEQFNLVYVNQQMADMLGYTPEETLGRNIHSFLLAEDIPGNIPRLNDRREGKSGRFERRFVTKDGRIRWMLVSATPIMDPDGTFRGSFAMCSDITERKQAEEALRESEAKFRAIFDSTFHFTGLLTPDGIMIEANRTALDFVGAGLSEVVNRPIWETPWWVGNTASIQRLKEAIQEAAKGTFVRYETEFWGVGNSTMSVDFSIKPVFDTSGRIRLLIPDATDITERKRAEEALRESEEKFRRIVETADEGIWKMNQTFETVYVNQRMADMLGYTPEEMTGRNIFSFMTPEDTTGFTSYIAERRQGKSGRYEHRFITKDGSARWIFVSATPLMDPDGTFRGSFAMCSDITERKTAEMEIARRNNELHAAYEQLTASEEEIRQNYDELAKSQHQLRESEQRYRNVVEDQTEFICRFLPDGTYVFANDAYCRYFGIKRDDILGHRFRIKIPAKDRERLHRFFASLTADHPIDSIEHRIIMPDGELRWQRWSDRAIFDSLGTITEYQSVGRDITGEKATQTALLENEKRLNTIFNTVEDAIFQLTVEPGGTYRFTSVNSAFGKITGLPHDQIIGKRVNEIIPGPSLEMVLEKYRQAIEEKAIVHWEETSNYPAGQLTGEVSLAPIFDKAGTCTHLIGSVHDITGRKRAEAALCESEKRFRELSDLLPQIIYEVDTDGNLLYSNRIAFERFRYTDDDFRRGLNIWQMIAPEDRERAGADFRTEVEGKGRQGGRPAEEYMALRKDGSTFPITIYSSPILVNGRITGLRGIIVDITERRRTENALRHTNSQLNLLTGITRHDILNKVSVALGYLSIIQMKSADPALVEYLNSMRSAITTIQSQIEFTRVYQDLGIHDPQWIVLDSVMPREVPASVHLDVAVQGITVFADPMLEKVFFNLLDNSIRHGTRVTDIRVSSHLSGDDLVVVWEDNGTGIAADDKDRIFDRGFGKNTGLGLFLVREILSLTEITIAETGEPGKGARFEITLPKGSYRFADAQ